MGDNLRLLLDKNFCCGCEACKIICPKNAIIMIEDERGFKYPYVNNGLCIDCQLCKKTCPINEKE